MTLSVDLFFSSAAHTAISRCKDPKLVADYDLDVNLRPVYPLAVRVPGFFKRANPQFARYVVRDSSRVAQHENIPFAFLGPIRCAGHDDARRREHQPYIHRLTGLVPRRSSKAGRWPLPMRSAACCGTAASRAGTRAIISPRGSRRRLRSRRDGCGDSSRSRALRAGDISNEQDHAASGIGACRPSRSKASRSSDRTASTLGLAHEEQGIEPPRQVIRSGRRDLHPGAQARHPQVLKAR